MREIAKAALGDEKRLGVGLSALGVSSSRWVLAG